MNLTPVDILLVLITTFFATFFGAAFGIATGVHMMLPSVKALVSDLPKEPHAR